MRNTLALTLVAALLSTSAFALEPRQPTGAAGVANMKAFQAWVNTKQPKHVVATASSCKVPIWSAACGASPNNGYNGYSDRDGGGKGDGAGGHDSSSK